MTGPLLADGINADDMLGSSVEVGPYEVREHTVDEVKQHVFDLLTAAEADGSLYDAALLAEVTRLRDDENAGDQRATLLPALDKLVEELTPFEPYNHNIEDVKARVGTNPDEINDIRAAEVGGKNRVTLVAWLDEQIAAGVGQPPADEPAPEDDPTPDPAPSGMNDTNAISDELHVELTTADNTTTVLSGTTDPAGTGAEGNTTEES